MPCAWGSMIWSSVAAAGFSPICSLLRFCKTRASPLAQQWVPGTMALCPGETQHIWARKCHVQENQALNSPLLIVWSCLPCWGNPPVECLLWENKAWVSCEGMCPFQEVLHSHTFKKPDSQTAEVTHHRPFRNSKRQAKHSDYNSVLTATENTTN